MNLTPPPSQNSHAVRWHCTAESERIVAESWFLCRRPTDQQACDRVSKGRRDPTHWLDPMTQRQLDEKCDEPGCLNFSPSYEWLPQCLFYCWTSFTDSCCYYYYSMQKVALFYTDRWWTFVSPINILFSHVLTFLTFKFFYLTFTRL